MIKLLVGITLSEIGGSQKVVYDIISNLPEDRYEITLLTSPNGDLLNWVDQINLRRANPINIIAWSCLRREISPLQDLIALFKLIRQLSTQKYDVVHFHNSKMGLIGRIAARIARIPKIYYTVHGWGLNPQTTGRLYFMLSMIERFLSRFTTEVIFVSKQDMEQGIKNHWATKDHSSVIYNGIGDQEAGSLLAEPPVDLRELLKVSKEIPIIGFVARLADPKDPLFAIQISKFLSSQGIDHRLCIIGNGPKYEDCGRLIESLGLKQQVALLGMRTDVRSLLNYMDLFCLFSKWEGLPICVLEAMHSGLPIVASNVGGLPEMIDQGESGFLVEGGNVEEATELIASLLHDVEARKAMGVKAKAAAYSRFQLSEMVSRYQALYEIPSSDMLFSSDVAGLTVVPVETIESLSLILAQEWQELLGLRIIQTPFTDPELLMNWWRIYGNKRKPLLLTFYEKERLVGILPLMMEKKFFHQLIFFMGHPENTHPSPIIRPGYDVPVIAAFFRYVQSIDHPLIFDFSGLRRDLTFSSSLIKHLAKEGTPSLTSDIVSPVIRVGDLDYARYYEDRFSSHGRKNHRKDEKNLSAMGSLCYRDLNAEDMPVAFFLHDQRWKAKWDTSGFTTPRSRSFFTALLCPSVPQPCTSGSPPWETFALGLYLDDRMIAFQYGFRNDKRALFYKSAHDIHLNKHAPGKLIKRECVKRCFEKGLAEIDLGVGYEEYKQEWTDDQDSLLGLVFPKSDWVSRLIFLYYYIKGRLHIKLKQSRRIVLFKRNTLGRWKYFLSRQRWTGKGVDKWSCM
jgi:glycosyltransferase involved in cell wall biosynthesis/CelD/BcsL family acetyltransferase involved in cellulose biosynthesis